jgi:ABC-type transport system involved in Fe-S cluster assembly fused permease/ATPase subunit
LAVSFSTTDCPFVPKDHKTDSVIQSSLRHELGGDVTLITVAHRLQTIMDADKIVSPACLDHFILLINI